MTPCLEVALRAESRSATQNSVAVRLRSAGAPLLSHPAGAARLTGDEPRHTSEVPVPDHPAATPILRDSCRLLGRARKLAAPLHPTTKGRGKLSARFARARLPPAKDPGPVTRVTRVTPLPGPCPGR